MKSTKSIGSLITDIYISMMLSIFVLLACGGYAKIAESKWTVFWILSLAYIFAMAIFCICYLNGSDFICRFKDALKKNRAMYIALLIYILSSALSFALAINKRIAFFGTGRRNGFLTIALQCIVFFLVSIYGQIDFKKLAIFGASMSVCSLIGIIQFFGKNPFNLYPEGVNYYDANIRYPGEYLGTIGNADILAAIYSLAIPMFLICIVLGKDRKKYFAIIPLILCIAVLLKSFVLAGIVGVSAGIIFCIPALSKNRKFKKIFVIVVLVTAICLGTLLLAFGPDNLGSSRILIWKESLKLFLEKPLLGTGPDTIGLRMNISFERYIEELGRTVYTYIDDAHCGYLNILVNQGIIALASYLALILLALKDFFQKSGDTFKKLVGAGLTGYIICSMFSVSSPICDGLFWIMLGLYTYKINFDNSSF